jgi:hypothetical protein
MTAYDDQGRAFESSFEAGIKKVTSPILSLTRA